VWAAADSKWRDARVIKGGRRSAVAGLDRPDRVPAWPGPGERASLDVPAVEQRVSADSGPADSGPAGSGPAWRIAHSYVHPAT
jgi:hypothetical protein